MNQRQAFLVVVIVALAVLWAARAILAPFVISAGLAYAFAPVVSGAHARSRWPRPVIVGLGYLILAAGVVVLAALTSGRIGAELAALSAAGPDLIASAMRQVLGSDSVTVAGTTVTVADLGGAVRDAIASAVATPGSAIHLAGLVVDMALQAFLVLVVTFYLLVDAERLRGWALGLVPASDRAHTAEVLDRIQDTLAKWLRGQLLLIALVAVVAYLFLGPVLHVRYALAIGVLTGILEIIPLVGPLIAAVIAMTAALVAGGPGTAIVVAIGYIVIRQVEDQLVMPLVIGRAVHLHPVVTIFAVLAGLSIYGVLGGLLAVPIAAAANVVFTDLYAARVRPEVPAEPPEPDQQGHQQGPPLGPDGAPALD